MPQRAVRARRLPTRSPRNRGPWDSMADRAVARRVSDGRRASQIRTVATLGTDISNSSHAMRVRQRDARGFGTSVPKSLPNCMFRATTWKHPSQASHDIVVRPSRLGARGLRRWLRLRARDRCGIPAPDRLGFGDPWPGCSVPVAAAPLPAGGGAAQEEQHCQEGQGDARTERRTYAGGRQSTTAPAGQVARAPPAVSGNGATPGACRRGGPICPMRKTLLRACMSGLPPSARVATYPCRMTGVHLSHLSQGSGSWILGGVRRAVSRGRA
jgi:hypothetical protein